MSPELLAGMERCLQAVVQESNRRERCAVVLEPIGHIASPLCDPGMQTALREVAEAPCPGGW